MDTNTIAFIFQLMAAQKTVQPDKPISWSDIIPAVVVIAVTVANWMKTAATKAVTDQVHAAVNGDRAVILAEVKSLREQITAIHLIPPIAPIPAIPAIPAIPPIHDNKESEGVRFSDVQFRELISRLPRDVKGRSVK